MTWKSVGDAARDVAERLTAAERPGNDRKYHCAFPGCWRTTDRYPYVVGWSNLCGSGPGIPDGFYCKPHADAIEALDESGELDYIQSAAKRTA